MFDATKSQFSDVQFQQINVDEDKDLSAKYGIHGIPHVVFLDASGNVLSSETPAMSPDGWANMIKQYH